MKQFQLKITSAVVIEGQIKMPDTIVVVDERLARDLLAREKAVPDDTPQDGAAEVQEEAASGEEAEAPAPAPKPTKGKAK